MIKLGDIEFEIPRPGAMQSFAFQQRILPVAGRIVAVFFRVLGMSPDSSPEALLDADVTRVLPQALPYIGEVFAAMPNGELDAITRELLGKGTFSKGKPLFGSSSGTDAIDALMAGKTMDMWRLLWHALEVWYPDFFDRAAALFANRKKAKDSEASST